MPRRPSRVKRDGRLFLVGLILFVLLHRAAPHSIRIFLRCCSGSVRLSSTSTSYHVHVSRRTAAVTATIPESSRHSFRHPDSVSLGHPARSRNRQSRTSYRQHQPHQSHQITCSNRTQPVPGSTTWLTSTTSTTTGTGGMGSTRHNSTAYPHMRYPPKEKPGRCCRTVGRDPGVTGDEETARYSSTTPESTNPRGDPADRPNILHHGYHTTSSGDHRTTT